MATEKLELQILANGKPAEKAIKGVEKKTEQLGKTSKKVGKEADGMLTRMKAGWIAVGASVAIAVNKAATFERASIGLTKAQKDWAKETALATDITAEQVAGFLKSAETAGLAEEQMKDLAKQAIALGYAFPHEDAETLHDNLVMLNTTGEAQGFMVDILEQHYASLGVQFEDIDLKATSMAEKLEIINEVVAKSQEQMDASKFQDYNKVMGTIDNTLTDLGATLVTLGSDGKGFSLASKAVEAFSLAIKIAAAGLAKLKRDFVDFAEYIGLVEEQKVVSEDLTTTQKEQLTVEQQLAQLQERRAMLVRSLTIGDKKWKESTQRNIDAIDKQIASLNEFGDAHEKARQQIQQSKDTNDSFTESLTEGIDLESFGKGWKDATGDVKSATDQWKAAGQSSANAIGSYLTNMIMGVKTSFSDLTRFIISQLVQMAVMQKIVTPLGNLMFGAHTGTTEVKHTGGAIGMAGIPSYHTGYRSDERLAKLQVGEAVINRHGASRNKGAIDAMNKGYAVGGGQQVTTAEINFNVTAIDAASFNNYLVGNKHTIENIINNSLQTNGTVRQTIKQVV